MKMTEINIYENGDGVGSIDTETQTGTYDGDVELVNELIGSLEDGLAEVTNDDTQDTDDGELLPPSKTVELDDEKIVEFVTGN